ncbi:hypothetical protein OG589_27905 [Sphaerisporangium sp. NBC_01403]|uniref:hypothetical protein n=1 Tax=Sphaerisporangium sp. NBC_01403 TaxID=2903599 RepID=UPI00325565E1
MARRRPARRGGRRSGGDGIMLAMVGLVVAVPVMNATVGFVRASSPWLLVTTLAVAAVVIAVALLALHRRESQARHDRSGRPPRHAPAHPPAPQRVSGADEQAITSAGVSGQRA